MPKSLKLTVNSKFIIFMICILSLTIGGLSVYINRLWENQHRDFLLKSFQITNQQTDRQLQQSFQQLITTTSNLATQITSSNQSASSSAHALLTQTALSHSEILNILVLNADRQVVAASSPENQSKQYPTSTYLQDIILGQTYNLGRITPNLNQQEVLPLFHRVQSASESSSSATIVVFEINPQFISSLMPINDPQTGPYTYLIDNRDQLHSQQYQRNQTGPDLTPVTNCRQEQQTTTGYWQNLQEQTVIGASQCLSLHNLAWVLVTEQPVGAAFAANGVTRYAIAITSALIVIGVGFISWLLFRPMFSTPIKNLKTAIITWNQGQLEPRLFFQTGDEFETIAEPLNHLIDKLQQQTNRLSLTTKLLLTRDINLRQANEQIEQEKNTLQAEQNKLSLILAGISDAVIAVDRDRHIVMLNPAAEQLTGYRFHQILGKPVDQVLTLMSAEGQFTANEYAPARTPKSDLIAFQKDNVQLIGARRQTAYINITSMFIQDRSAFNVDSIITLHDVTKEQDLERMKLDFVSMAAHELRTPLTAVQGYLSMVQNNAPFKKLPAQDQDYISKAAQSSLRLNKLIENLLAVSRIQQGRFTLQTEEIHIEQMVQKIIEELESVAKERNLHLTYTPSPKPLPTVMADSLRIEEVLSNLIGNALKYTPQGSVHVLVTQQDTDIVISVKDTGPGIAPDAMAHLFTKFFRIKSDLSAGTKGTGLGLYISKNIIESHGGKIWAESQPNQGATFSFSLPIATSVKNA